MNITRDDITNVAISFNDEYLESTINSLVKNENDNIDYTLHSDSLIMTIDCEENIAFILDNFCKCTIYLRVKYKTIEGNMFILKPDIVDLIESKKTGRFFLTLKFI